MALGLNLLRVSCYDSLLSSPRTVSGPLFVIVELIMSNKGTTF